MKEQSVRPLLDALAAERRLARAARPLDTEEMAAVALKTWHERGRGLRFAAADGTQAAAHILSDRAQWATALGAPADGVLAFVERALSRRMEPAMAEGALARTAPRFDRWPVPRASVGDAAPHVAAVALAADPDDGRVYLGLTRHHVVAADRLSVIDLNPTLDALHRRHSTAGRPMPLALAIGADPALILAAAIGTWRKAELGLAGALSGAPVRVLRAAAAPAEAEFVVLGTLSPDATARSGRLSTPFGTHQEDPTWPVLHAEAVLVRRDPIFHAMQGGAAGDLAGARGLAAEALVAQHIRNIEGGIDFLDIRVPAAAGGQVVVVKMRPRLEGQAKTVLLGALSGPVNAVKLAIAVDEDVDAGDLRDVFWSVASRTHAEKDVGMIRGLRAHALDFASPLAGYGAERTGTRWFIDSTMPPLTQAKRREDFARAIPKNLAAVDLSRFLPKGER